MWVWPLFCSAVEREKNQSSSKHCLNFDSETRNTICEVSRRCAAQESVSRDHRAGMFGGIMLYEWQTEDAGGSHGSSTSNEITASLAAFLNGKETKKLYVSHEKKNSAREPAYCRQLFELTSLCKWVWGYPGISHQWTSVFPSAPHTLRTVGIQARSLFGTVQLLLGINLLLIVHRTYSNPVP